MNIGNQIKSLRQRRGITQETMAQHFGITAQAVSKWECGTSVPDIGMLPELSAYFGVSIDTLFALDDELRIDRIQNMLWDVRFLNPADVENERSFLLEKLRREPDNPDLYCMLVQIELHLAQEHRTRAEDYAMEIIARTPREPYVGFMYLSRAMNGTHYDPRFNLRNRLIAVYEAHLAKHPDCVDAYQWLIGQLIADHRLSDAEHYCKEMEKYESGYSLTVEKIKLALAKQDAASAKAMWEQMGAEYPNNFTVWQWIGDFQTQTEAYAEAKESYRRSISLLKAPRYNDPIIALALCCEMDGDYEGAIAARKLELEISETEWNSSTGESVEAIKREIVRLERLQNKKT